MPTVPDKTFPLRIEHVNIDREAVRHGIAASRNLADNLWCLLFFLKKRKERNRGDKSFFDWSPFTREEVKTVCRAHGVMVNGGIHLEELEQAGYVVIVKNGEPRHWSITKLILRRLYCIAPAEGY